MPISAGDLSELAKVSLDEYMTKEVEDNIATTHPLLDKLMEKRKNLSGGKQNVITSARKAYSTNFSWSYGETAVGFNKRNTTENAQFPWRVCVDGYYLDHDRLYGNGIDVREGQGKFTLQSNEKVQLVQLMDEQNESFKLGFLEKLDVELHRSGVASTDAVTGLDGLITLTPAVGTVAGIDRATNVWWRNYAKTGISVATKGTLTNEMEIAWRACMRNGGMPDFIMAGTDFIDAYRNELVATYNVNNGAQKVVEAGTESLKFKGIPVIWNPIFSTLQTLEAPATSWEKRCYFINTKYFNYRDNDLNISNPTRPYNIRAIYTMAVLRLAITSNRLNAHGVISIA